MDSNNIKLRMHEPTACNQLELELRVTQLEAEVVELKNKLTDYDELKKERDLLKSQQSPTSFQGDFQNNFQNEFILESITDAFFALNHRWEFTYLNKQAENLLFRNRAELLGRSIWQEFAFAVATPFYTYYHQAVNSGQAVHFEEYYSPLDSWFEVHAYPYSDGLLVYFSNINRRKTEEKERENLLAQLQTEQEKLKTLIEHMPVGIILAEAPSGRIMMNNRQVVEILRHPPIQVNTVENYDAWVGYHEDGRLVAGHEWPLARALKGEVTIGEDFLYERGDGTKGWIRVSGAPVIGPNNEIVSSVIAFFDIDEQKREADRLLFLEEASAILASSLDYAANLTQISQLIVPKLADFCFFEIQENNATPLRITQTNRPAVSETHLPPFENPLPQLLEHGDCSIIYVPLFLRMQPLGHFVFASHKSSRLYTPQDLALVEELARRVTVAVENARLYREVYSALETRQELDYLKDLFVAVAGHELRTPLTSIKGYAQILQRNLLKAASEQNDNPDFMKNLRSVENIVRQTGRMQAMINQLLDFSRIQTNKLELNDLRESNLAEAVERVVEQNILANTTHKITYQTARDSIVLKYDETRLEQVLDNLIGNAIKYSPAGSTVTVSVTKSSDEAIISVADEGFGISAEDQAHLFERFYRVRSKETGSIQGLGLGLYVSKEIVVKHGGRMWVVSEPGKGSTFNIALPLH